MMRAVFPLAGVITILLGMHAAEAAPCPCELQTTPCPDGCAACLMVEDTCECQTGCGRPAPNCPDDYTNAGALFCGLRTGQRSQCTQAAQTYGSCSGCKPGFYGADCTETCQCGPAEECNEGIAGDGACTPVACEKGFFGLDCQPCTCTATEVCDDGALGTGFCLKVTCGEGSYGLDCTPCSCAADEICQDGVAGTGACIKVAKQPVPPPAGEQEVVIDPAIGAISPEAPVGLRVPTVPGVIDDDPEDITKKSQKKTGWSYFGIAVVLAIVCGICGLSAFRSHRRRKFEGDDCGTEGRCERVMGPFLSRFRMPEGQETLDSPQYSNGRPTTPPPEGGDGGDDEGPVVKVYNPMSPIKIDAPSDAAPPPKKKKWGVWI